MPLSNAQLLMQQHHYKEALRVAQLELWSGELSETDTAEAHYLIGRALLKTQQYYAAVHALTKARQLALEHAQPMLGAVELNLGTTYLWLGDLAEAAQMLHAGLDRPGLSTGQQGGAMFNLAVIEQERGHYSDAASLYRIARDYDRQAGNCRAEVDSTLGAAWCYLMEGDVSAAKPILDEVALLTALTPTLPVADLSYPHAALYHRLCGDLVGSMNLCEQAMATNLLQGMDYHLTVGEAAWIAGQNALDLEHYAESRLLAQQAIQHGLNLQWPSLLNRANQLRRQAERALNRP